MSVVFIGHAGVDMNGIATGGSSGKELRVGPWHDKGWKKIFIPVNEKTGNEIVETLEKACANKKISSGKPQDATLYDEALKVKWDFSNIKVPCVADNSTLIVSCLNAVGTHVPKGQNLKQICTYIVRSAQFLAETNKEYLTKSEKLKKGSILVTDNDIVIVMNDGDKVNRRDAQQLSFDLSKVNTFFVGKEKTKAKINVRTVPVYSGPGSQFLEIGSVKRGVEISILEVLDDGWFKIVYASVQSGYAYIKGENTKEFILADDSILPKEAGVEVDYKIYITTNVANLREGPGKEYQVIGHIYNREKYSIIREVDDWGLLASEKGWINLKFTNKILN